MSDAAIQVNDLGKRYRIGAAERYKTLRESLTRAASAPLRWMRPALRSGEANTIWALRGVSFQVGRGEAVGIIGRNGAGKSTLLKVLSRITAPTEGSVDMNGRVGSLLEVGTGFHPELTGRENIYLNGAILGMRRAEIQRRFDEIVAFSETERFLDTPVKRYSSGMYMRLAFAVAAHLEPEILIVDEVLAVGDAQFQAKCLGRMKSIAGAGRTVLFVSHNMAAVAQLCNRAILLNEGRVEADGPAAGVVERYWGGTGADAPSVPVSLTQQRGATDMLHLAEVRLLNPAGGSFSVRWKERILLELKVVAHRRLTDVVFSMGLVSIQGTVVSGAHSDDSEASPPYVLEPGVHRVRLSLSNPLRAGHYVLALGAEHSLTRDNFYHVDAAARLAVMDASADDEPYPYHLQGLVNIEAQWSVSDDSVVAA